MDTGIIYAVLKLSSSKQYKSRRYDLFVRYSHGHSGFQTRQYVFSFKKLAHKTADRNRKAQND